MAEIDVRARVVVLTTPAKFAKAEDVARDGYYRWAGVYVLHRNGSPLYVGQSLAVGRRLLDHRHGGRFGQLDCVEVFLFSRVFDVNGIEIAKGDLQQALWATEQHLIRRLMPIENRSNGNWLSSIRWRVKQ